MSVAQKSLGFLLVAFTVLLGLVAILFLACTLTQTRMSSITFSGVTLSVWKLYDLQAPWGDLRGQITSRSKNLVSAEEKKNETDALNAKFDLTYRPARTALDAKLGPFVNHLKKLDPDLEAAMKDQGPVERLEQIELEKDNLIKKEAGLKDQIIEMERLGKEYKKIDEDRIKVRRQAQDATANAEAAQKNLIAAQAALDNVFARQLGVQSIDPPTRARIENALFELQSSPRLAPLIKPILRLPPEIMSLILVVLMGILGSSLQLTHQLFIRKEAESVGVYALRLSVGAITALVIFIVAKAGVPIVADASKLGGDTPINPYFVSFLAIISGLMSEKAIASVQAQAGKYFDSGTNETLRWARAELREAVAQTQRTPAHLAKSLDVSETALNDWLSGKEPVPVASQKLLAAVVDRPVRDLFSDIAPEEILPPTTQSSSDQTSRAPTPANPTSQTAAELADTEPPQQPASAPPPAAEARSPSTTSEKAEPPADANARGG
jgi:transcriptional regulator with XRE-family HTH domain